MKKQLVTQLCGLACLLALVVAPGTATAKVAMKFGHGAPESTALHTAWVHFKKIVEERSKGEIEVQLYGNQQLGADRELTEATQLDNISGCAVSTANAAPFNPQLFVFDIPFLFKNHAEAYAALDGAPGQAVLASMSKANLMGAGYMENGFRDLTNSRREITKPEDLNGIKLRTMENAIQMAMWRALGANPTPMAFGELFTALQQKTVDGQENPMELIYNNKFYEVQPYLTKTHHIYSPYIMMFSVEFWQGLKPEQQKLLMECVKEAVAYHRELVTKSAQEAEAGIRKNGNKVVELNAEQLKAFREKASVVMPMIKEKLDPAIYALFVK